MMKCFTLLFISAWVAASLDAQQIHFNNAESSQLRRLSALEGTWIIAGEPKGNVPADTVVTYCKWSPTGRYLICDQVVKSVKGNSTDLAIYTYDSPRKEYQFYTAGISGEKPSSAILQIESNTWIYVGEYNNLSAIDIGNYIYELVEFLRGSFNIGNRIKFELDIDSLELDLAHCIPLGLILNEAITNAVKYAFPNQSHGKISIGLKHQVENKIVLTIKDNGIGLPPGFDINGSRTMGMNLMKGLSEQLRGQLSISGENGTCIDIDFAYDPSHPTDAGSAGLLFRRNK